MRVLTEPSRACGSLPLHGIATQREFVPVEAQSDQNLQSTFQDLITQLPPVKPTDASKHHVVHYSGHIDRRRKRFGVESQRCSNFNPAPDTILRDRKRFATVTTDELHG